LRVLRPEPGRHGAHADALTGYDTSKGTVRFATHSPLPDDLVTTLVKARLAETDAAAKRA
jgi:uncharacterized protein YdhG (YjbR/CyaY superfamily)